MEKEVNGAYMRIDFKDKRQLITVIAIALTLCFIFGQSMLSAHRSMAASDAVIDAIDGITDSADKEGETDENGTVTLTFLKKHLRKIAHFAEYGLLGSLVFLLLVFIGHGEDRNKYMPFPKNKLPMSLLFGFLVAFTDESIQIISKRGSSILDVWIDLFGYTTLTFILAIICFLIKFIREKRKEI